MSRGTRQTARTFANHALASLGIFSSSMYCRRSARITGNTARNRSRDMTAEEECEIDFCSSSPLVPARGCCQLEEDVGAAQVSETSRSQRFDFATALHQPWMCTEDSCRVEENGSARKGAARSNLEELPPRTDSTLQQDSWSSR